MRLGLSGIENIVNGSFTGSASSWTLTGGAIYSDIGAPQYGTIYNNLNNGGVYQTTNISVDRLKSASFKYNFNPASGSGSIACQLTYNDSTTYSITLSTSTGGSFTTYNFNLSSLSSGKTITQILFTFTTSGFCYEYIDDVSFQYSGLDTSNYADIGSNSYTQIIVNNNGYLGYRTQAEILSDIGFGTITNTPSIDQNLTTASTPTFAGITLSTPQNITGLKTTSSPTFTALTLSNSPVNNSDATRKDYVDLLVQGIDWQQPVIDNTLATPPVSPATNDRYIVATGGTGAWLGKDNQIAEWNGSAWVFTVPTSGFSCWVTTSDIDFVYNGTSWVQFAATVTHNNLSGLQGGTASQYYHLTSTEHTNLSGQDQAVKTTSSVTFNSLTLTTKLTSANINSITTSQISDLTTAATGITKLGTIGTGVWQASAIADTYISSASAWNTAAGHLDQDVKTTSSPTFASLTLSNSPTANSDAARKDYVDLLVQGIDWQQPVIDNTLATPPVSPATNDRYIVATGGTGAWLGKDNQIAEWNGSAWVFTVPTSGFSCWVTTSDIDFVYNGTSWVQFAATVTHNNLSGLQGGTASQYYHLTSTEHTNLSGQDQAVKTTSSVTFNSLTLTTAIADTYISSASTWNTAAGHLDQDVKTTSSPTFANLTLTGYAAGSLGYTFLNIPIANDSGSNFFATTGGTFTKGSNGTTRSQFQLNANNWLYYLPAIQVPTNSSKLRFVLRAIGVSGTSTVNTSMGINGNSQATIDTLSVTTTEATYTGTWYTVTAGSSILITLKATTNAAIFYTIGVEFSN